MGKQFARIVRGGLGLGLAVLACGCGGEDTARLGRVGRLTMAKFGALTRGVRAKLAGGWQGARAAAGEDAIDGRVAQRLRWDKDMVGAEVQVSAPEPGVVRLQGTVSGLTQRRRAVALAQSTLGVQEVLDELTAEDGAGNP